MSNLKKLDLSENFELPELKNKTKHLDKILLTKKQAERYHNILSKSVIGGKNNLKFDEVTGLSFNGKPIIF